MGRSKADPNQITQITFDEELEAVRVHVLPTEMSVALSADEGDSVLTHKQMQVLSVEADQMIDTSKASRLSILCDSSVSITLVALGHEVTLPTQLSPGQVLEICVPVIKANKACIVILQS